MVKTKTVCLQVLLWTDSPNFQVIFSSPLPLKEPWSCLTVEWLTVSPLRTQNLLLPFPITYFLSPWTPNEFGKNKGLYHHPTSYMFSYPVFRLSPHTPLLTKCNSVRVKTGVSFHYLTLTVYPHRHSGTSIPD